MSYSDLCNQAIDYTTDGRAIIDTSPDQAEPSANPDQVTLTIGRWMGGQDWHCVIVTRRGRELSRTHWGSAVPSTYYPYGTAREAFDAALVWSGVIPD